jgi:hypothetical protein
LGIQIALAVPCHSVYSDSQDNRFHLMDNQTSKDSQILKDNPNSLDSQILKDNPNSLDSQTHWIQACHYLPMNSALDSQILKDNPNSQDNHQTHWVRACHYLPMNSALDSRILKDNPNSQDNHQTHWVRACHYLSLSSALGSRILKDNLIPGRLAFYHLVIELVTQDTENLLEHPHFFYPLEHDEPNTSPRHCPLQTCPPLCPKISIFTYEMIL